MFARRRTGPVATAHRTLVTSDRTRQGVVAARDRTGWPAFLREVSGAQLVEMAFALPFLLVIAIGVIDFGEAYNLKHKLTNAAREAARVTVSNPVYQTCSTTNPPCSIQAAAEAVKIYLANAGLSGVSCIDPTSPSSGDLTSLSWTYSCSGITLVIDRNVLVPGGPSGASIPSTQVTLTYPYTWSFQRVIGLIAGSATLPSTLSTSVTMQNLM